jgi:uncharacterized protein (DUF305 family)
VALVVALCFLAGAAGWTVGRGRPPGRGSTDVGFLYDMINHHHQAVAMSRTELFRGETQGATIFAEEILRFQSYEIGLMSQMLAEWGHAVEDPPEIAMAWMGHAVHPDAMPGMATPDELDRLEAASGREADALFLALMADHHAGAVDMAETAAREAADGDVRALADRMARAQRFEVRELLGAATRAGLDTTPPGLTIDLYDPETGAVLDDVGSRDGH